MQRHSNIMSSMNHPGVKQAAAGVLHPAMEKISTAIESTLSKELIQNIT